jgi:hypothetical protein
VGNCLWVYISVVLGVEAPDDLLFLDTGEAIELGFRERESCPCLLEGLAPGPIVCWHAIDQSPVTVVDESVIIISWKKEMHGGRDVREELAATGGRQGRGREKSW